MKYDNCILAVVLLTAAAQICRADPQSDAPPDKAVALTAPFNEGAAKTAQHAWARHISKLSPVDTNSIDMELVLIPPGTFLMGSPSSEVGRFKNENQVSVTLTQLFYLGRTEVTQRQWQAVMGTMPWKGQPFVHEGPNYPASYVTSEDAQAFCRLLSEKEGSLYRLPTEAEWEYACRAGTATQYNFGDDAAALTNYAWFGLTAANGVPQEAQTPRQVGLKRPNAFGLEDLHGNVWEWCQDKYVEKLPGGLNPLVVAGGKFQVYRGGGWPDLASACRSADRNSSRVNYASRYLGFRVARSSPVD